MPPLGPVPLVAAGFDWLEALLPLLFVVFWVVSQVVNLVRRVAGEPARPRVEPVMPPRRPAARGDGGGIDDARADLERQIAEFLERSRGGRAAEPPAPSPRRQPPRPPRSPVARPLRPQSAAPTPLRGAPPQLPTTARSSVAARHLDPLGAAGDDVAEHVQDAFKRQLSHLESSLTGGAVADAPRGSPSAAGSAATDLAAALRDPVAVRRMILLREVLDRPVDRWE